MADVPTWVPIAAAVAGVVSALVAVYRLRFESRQRRRDREAGIEAHLETGLERTRRQRYTTEVSELRSWIFNNSDRDISVAVERLEYRRFPVGRLRNPPDGVAKRQEPSGFYRLPAGRPPRKQRHGLEVWVTKDPRLARKLVRVRVEYRRDGGSVRSRWKLVRLPRVPPLIEPGLGGDEPS